jgi:F0F1-type ATP synthase assembly protein I
MVGSGFIGWPFVVGWLVVLTVLWWIRPLRGADRKTRIVCGVSALLALALLLSLGGFYLIPAVIAWLALVVVEGRRSALPPPKK